MVFCVAYGCFNNTKRNGNKQRTERVGFFRFPKDPALRGIWVRAVGRENWTPNDYSRLCSDHFSEERLNATYPSRLFLKEGAVPNLFPGNPAYRLSSGKQKKSRTKRTLSQSRNDYDTVSEMAQLNTKIMKVEFSLVDSSTGPLLGNLEIDMDTIVMENPKGMKVAWRLVEVDHSEPEIDETIIEIPKVDVTCSVPSIENPENDTILVDNPQVNPSIGCSNCESLKKEIERLKALLNKGTTSAKRKRRKVNTSSLS